MIRLDPLPARPKLCVAISGGGTTLANLLKVIREGGLDAEITGVIANRDGIAGIAIARDAGVPVTVLTKVEDTDDAAYSAAFFDAAAEADLVVMAGFLAFVEIPDRFTHRVVNIHPSLIPAFAGKGYYGLRVHRAVLERGCRVTGCTAHFVDNEYDHGPIIDQRTVPVQPSDTPETLAARVFEAECELYPAAIRQVAAGGLLVDGRRVLPASQS